MGKEPSDFVKLAGTIAGIFLVIVIMFMVLAKEHIVLLQQIAWAFVALGVFLGFFQYLAIKKK